MKLVTRLVIEIILLAVFAAFWLAEFVMGIGFLEIIFNIRLTSPDYVIIIWLALWALSAFIIYFVLILLKFGSTPGVIVAGRKMGKPLDHRPFYAYIGLLAIVVLSYVVFYAVANPVFDKKVSAQEKTLANMGVSLDWKSYYPKIKYTDKENAAPEINKAAKKLDAGKLKELEDLWESLTGSEGVDMAEFSRKAEGLYDDNEEAIAALDKALKMKYFLEGDVSMKKDNGVPDIVIPNFADKMRAIRLSAVAAAGAAHKGDFKPIERHVERLERLVHLILQDPTMISAMVALRMQSDLYDTLNFVMRTAPVKKSSYRTYAELLAKKTKWIEGVRESLINGVRFEIAYAASYQKALKDMPERGDFLGKGGLQKAAGALLFDIYYGLWGRYDRYIYLRGAEIALKGVMAEDAAKQDLFSRDARKFAEKNEKIASVIASSAIPSFDAYIERFALYSAKKDVSRIFAAALDYRTKFGRYPGGLSALVPEFMETLPVNPVDGKPYDYAAEGGFMEVFAMDFNKKRAVKSAFAGTRPASLKHDNKLPAKK